MIEIYLTGNKIKGERWQSIANFPDYEVSDLGRVRKMVQVCGARRWYKIKAQSFNAAGNMLVGMRNEEGKNTTRTVSYLVLSSFVGPGEYGQEIQYLDGNKVNCRLDNLRYREDIKPFKPRTSEATAREVKRMLAQSRRQCHIAAELGIGNATVKAIRDGRLWGQL